MIDSRSRRYHRNHKLNGTWPELTGSFRCEECIAEWELAQRKRQRPAYENCRIEVAEVTGISELAGMMADGC